MTKLTLNSDLGYQRVGENIMPAPRYLKLRFDANKEVLWTRTAYKIAPQAD